MKNLLLFLLVVLFITGCAEIELPKPTDVISAPFNSITNTRLGDSKEEVLSRWGDPDEKNEIGLDELGVKKEEWVYYGKYPGAPVDYRNLSKTKYLYFEGNILVRQDTKSAPRPKPQGKPEE